MDYVTTRKRMQILAVFCTLAGMLIGAILCQEARGDSVTSGSVTRLDSALEPAGMVVVLELASDDQGRVRASVENLPGVLESVTLDPNGLSTATVPGYDVRLRDVDDLDVLRDEGVDLTTGSATALPVVLVDGPTSATSPRRMVGPLALEADDMGSTVGLRVRMVLGR
jgi:hypothetical protein